MNINQNIDSLFSTSDLSLAAFLLSYYPLWAIERKDTNKSNFVFQRDSNLDKYIQSFWRKEIRVEPIDYFAQIKLIKSRLYENK